MSAARDSLDVFRPGDSVTWLCEQRGGWGYVWRVPAYVVKVTSKRVGIAASKRDGSWVPRWVTANHLAPRNESGEDDVEAFLNAAGLKAGRTL